MIDMQRRVWEQEAREKGFKDGELEATLKFIERGLVSIEDVVKDLDISISELEEAARKAEIKLPKMV